MRFSEAWLREWIDPPLSTAALADQLSMAGLEVDAVVPVAPPFDGVVVGQIIGVDAHPDAAKLRLCRVAVGDDAELPIVCGAANVATGMRVAVALVGATLPGDIKIKRARLRGIESLGMICSARELGLAETSDGILPLPDDAPIGADLRAWLSLDDQAIELDLTPDRGDCLSLLGVAREVAAINRLPWHAPLPPAVAARNEQRWPVDLIAPAACPRYACRLVEGVNGAAMSPLWLRERLRRSGLRPINALVDVTNYVLLELGQPLHAFDAERLSGAIRVRMAEAGETLRLLNDETVTLNVDTLVIADANGPVAMAGIMGGAASAVTTGTRAVLLESAFFTPTAIAGRARRHGLTTDAAHRFERGVDPALQVLAIERATALLVEIAGGEPGPVVDVVDQTWQTPLIDLDLRRARIAQVLGLEVADDTVVDLLERLGMQTVARSSGWRVRVPSHRFDVRREVDLIAEIGRLFGYDAIPARRALSATGMKARREADFDLDQARARLVARGYHEVVTYSFISPSMQRSFDPESPALVLSNPISADLATMRTSLWPGLAQVARQNRARQQTRIRVFETGLRFRPDQDMGLRQEDMLAGLLLGDLWPEQWSAQPRMVDFFDCKGDVETLLALTGQPEVFRAIAADHPALHPGQSARLERAGQCVGWFGMLHPSLARQLDLGADAFLFELNLTHLATGVNPRCAPLSKFPSIRRDLAITVALDVPYERVAASIRVAAGEWLRDLFLFDVYQGEHVDSGRKSLALGLILQAYSQTLTEADIDGTVARVLDQLMRDVDARLRS